MAITLLFRRFTLLPLSWKRSTRRNGLDRRTLSTQTVTGDTLHVLLDIIDQHNPYRKLVTAVGMLSHLSNSMVVWRTFMTSLYAALHAPTRDIFCSER